MHTPNACTCMALHTRSGLAVQPYGNAHNRQRAAARCRPSVGQGRWRRERERCERLYREKSTMISKAEHSAAVFALETQVASVLPRRVGGGGCGSPHATLRRCVLYGSGWRGTKSIWTAASNRQAEL
jgi:hypothetical protein